MYLNSCSLVRDVHSIIIFAFIYYIENILLKEKKRPVFYFVDCFDNDKDCSKYEQKGCCYDPRKLDYSKSKCAKTCNLCGKFLIRIVI